MFGCLCPDLYSARPRLFCTKNRGLALKENAASIPTGTSLSARPPMAVHELIGPTILCFTCLLMIGCLSDYHVPAARPELETISRSIDPPAGKSLLYIVRKKGSLGSFAFCNVFIDGRPWGKIATGTYLAGIFDSGIHHITIEDGFQEIEIRSVYTIGLRPGLKHYLLLDSNNSLQEITFENVLYARERVMSEEYKLSGENRFADTLSPTYQVSLDEDESSSSDTSTSLPPSNVAFPNSSKPPVATPQQSMLSQTIDDTAPALCATTYKYRTALVIGNAHYEDAPLTVSMGSDSIDFEDNDTPASASGWNLSLRYG